MDNLPKFVSLGGTCLRLKADRIDNPEYWRDGGCWGVGVKIVNGRLYSTHSFVSSVDNIEMKPTTEEKWRKCNGHYAPNNI